MKISSSSLSPTLLSAQSARRWLGVSAPSVSLLVVPAIAAWTMPGLIGRGVVILAATIFLAGTRR